MSLFLGTGHGRSGTLWTSRFFTAIGFDTLHETQFAPRRHGAFHRPEVSWLAVPYAATHLGAEVRLLRVVRDPYDAVISMMQMDFQQQRRATPFDRFLARHRPDIVRPADKLTRSIRYVASWDRPLDDLAHVIIQPDTHGADQLQSVVEYATGVRVACDRIDAAMSALGTKVNTKPRRRPGVTRADINAHPEGWKIQQRAERFGYA